MIEYKYISINVYPNLSLDYRNRLSVSPILQCWQRMYDKYDDVQLLKVEDEKTIVLENVYPSKWKELEKRLIDISKMFPNFLFDAYCTFDPYDGEPNYFHFFVYDEKLVESHPQIIDATFDERWFTDPNNVDEGVRYFSTAN